jgi:hypothetical protein
MKNLLDKFLEHPIEQDETYFEHFSHAFRCGLLLSIASIACFAHSLIPFIFKKTATNIAKSVISKRCKEQKK